MIVRRNKLFDLPLMLDGNLKFYQSIKHLIWAKEEVPKKAKIIWLKSYFTLIVTFGAEVWSVAD